MPERQKLSRQDQIREYLNYHGSVDVTKYAEIVLALDEMTVAEREEMFAIMRGFFCVRCGDADPKSQCCNDE